MTQINLVYTFDNCVKRGATKAQLTDFLNRCERQFINDAPKLAIISDLRKELGQ
jgi:hypothetical protein